MAGMPPQGAPEAAPVTSASPEPQRHARYTHLLGRLRSRQITMEEATELFALMETMLRASEAARRVAFTAPARPGALPAPARPASPVPSPSSAPDDLFLVGLLAMGAGAGLLAAMARRLGEGTSARSGPEKDAEPRRGA